MTSGKQWIDPFDDVSDDEMDAYVDRLFATRPRTVGVSLRVPDDLLQRVKREAGRVGTPYQTFMKAMLEAAVERLERRGDSTRLRPHGKRPRTVTRRPDRRRKSA